MNLDSYADTGVLAAVELVNALAVQHAGGRPSPPRPSLPAIAQVLRVDPQSVAKLTEHDAPGFTALAHQLHELFDDLHRGDVDAAAARLNALLAKHPAHPYLAREDGRWRLHHHPATVALLPMWTAICAEALARMISAGYADRFGTCVASDCDRVFFDVSKNAQRRFCSTMCQNRAKAAVFRLRRGLVSATRDPGGR